MKWSLLVPLLFASWAWGQNPHTMKTFISGDTLSASEMNSNFQYLQWMFANNAITAAQIPNGSITAAKIDVMGGSNGQVLKLVGGVWTPAADNIGSPGPGSITSTELASDAVTSSKILDGTILGADISPMAGSNGQVLTLVGGVWSPANLPSGLPVGGQAANYILKTDGASNFSWTAPPIGIPTSGQSSGFLLTTDGASNFSWVAPGTPGANSVGSAQITDGSIAAADLSSMGAGNFEVLRYSGGVWAPTLMDGNSISASAITTTHILDGTITAADLANMGASNGQYLKYNGGWAPANLAVTGADISDGTITAVDLAGGAAEAPLTFDALFTRTGNIISLDPANGVGTNGYLTSVDWQMFNNKLDKTGGTMSGFITLHADPSAASHAANKNYVDNSLATMVNKSGDTMTGHLTLPGTNPTGFQAAHVNFTNATYITKPVAPSNGQVLQYNGAAWIASNAANSFNQNGNSFGAVATIGTNDNNHFDLRSNNVTRVRIDSGGNVGIGTTTSTYRLSVVEGSNTNANGTPMKVTSVLSHSGSPQYGTVIYPIINQAGSAGYAGLYVNADYSTYNSQGGGAKDLVRLAVDGNVKFAVNDKGFVDGQGFMGQLISNTNVTCYATPTCPGNCTNVTALTMDYGFFSGTYTTPTAGVYEIMVELPWTIATGAPTNAFLSIFDGTNEIKLQPGRNLKRFPASTVLSVHAGCMPATSSVTLQAAQTIIGIRKLH